MHTFNAIAIFIVILLIGLSLFLIALYATQLITKKQISVQTIFKDFRQKMWMTIGLGILFFGFYLLIILLGSSLISAETRRNIFFLAYKHPSVFIYIGLLIFAAISIGIYLVRIVIKHLYNTRN